MKIVEAEQKDKRAQLERLLQKGAVMVFVDARLKAVLVPEAHKANPRLPLNLDYAFGLPDFKVMETHVEGSLSFNQSPFFCVLPFDSIYMMTSPITGETVVFPENLPRDLKVQKKETHLSLINHPGQKKPHKPKKTKKKTADNQIKPAKAEKKPTLKLVE